MTAECCLSGYFCFDLFGLCFPQVPYKIKEIELDYDNYNQVPESPIGRDEEPHLYMVPKKYRKVVMSLCLSTAVWGCSAQITV